jgi:two-component system sensor histidine kinase/response regulator
MTSDDIAARRAKIVLAADDQAENLMILESLIEAQGYTFFGVETGLEAISLAIRISPRLILMDGYETCRRLRAIPDLKPVPIAFLTARKSSDDVREGLLAGGNDFIVKPFDPEKLISRVVQWTNRRLPAAA